MPYETMKFGGRRNLRLRARTVIVPEEGRFGDQMRRAGVSVMSDLAEGCGRTCARGQAHVQARWRLHAAPQKMLKWHQAWRNGEGMHALPQIAQYRAVGGGD